MYIQAGERISEFHYRKLFGLSKQDMLNEPLDDYFTNSFIQDTLSNKEKHEIKKTEMSSKMRGGSK